MELAVLKTSGSTTHSSLLYTCIAMYNDISKTILTRKTILIAGIIGTVLGIVSVVLFVVEQKSKGIIATDSYSNSNVKVSTYKDKGGLWGYDVYMHGALLIHQPHIPVVSGNRGFTTKADARRTGELVANKIRKNLIPPTLTIQELKDIGVVMK